MVRGFPVVTLMLGVAVQGATGEYHGKKIGPLTTIQHGVAGNVYAAQEDGIRVTQFRYDGRGPDAYFWAGTQDELYLTGDQLLDENGSTKVLGSYKDDIVYVKLYKKVSEYRSFGVFCKKFEADFGHVNIPVAFKPPKEQSLGKLIAKQPNTQAADVIMKDSATILLKEFEYDGSCTDAAFFVAIPSVNSKPEDMVHLTYDNGKKMPLERFDKLDVNVSLPEGQHWNEFQSFAVYCVKKKEILANATISKALAESVPMHNPKFGVKKPESTGKGVGSKPGPLSPLSVLSSSMAALVTTVAIRHCLDNGDPVERC